jgi:hypothetical protein
VTAASTGIITAAAMEAMREMLVVLTKVGRASPDNRRRALALFTAGLLIPTLSLANCENDAAAVARQFWEQHSRFYEKDDPDLQAATTPRFYAAIQREWACAAKNPACLGYQPWPHPGDKRLRSPPTFYVPVSRPDLWSVIRPVHVLVSMTYTMTDPDGGSGAEEYVVLTLTQGANDRCWSVDDVVRPEYGSFRGRFSRPNS